MCGSCISTKQEETLNHQRGLNGATMSLARISLNLLVFLGREFTEGWKWTPWPMYDHQLPERKGSKNTVVDTLPPLRWQHLTQVSSVPSQGSTCACPCWSPDVMTRWGLFLASRMRISCSCRAYRTLGSKMPYVKSHDMPCWTIAIFGDRQRRMKRKIRKFWQYQQILLSVPTL